MSIALATIEDGSQEQAEDISEKVKGHSFLWKVNGVFNTWTIRDEKNEERKDVKGKLTKILIFFENSIKKEREGVFY